MIANQQMASSADIDRDLKSTFSGRGIHGTLDFETKANYGFVVIVSDGRGGSDSAHVRISLVDVNEIPIFAFNCDDDGALIACPSIKEGGDWDPTEGESSGSIRGDVHIDKVGAESKIQAYDVDQGGKLSFEITAGNLVQGRTAFDFMGTNML